MLLPTLFLVIITSLLHPLPMCFSQSTTKYKNCGKPLNCGYLENVGYPFYGEDRPDYCGHPGFELNCKSDAPLITIQSVIYRVLKLNYGARILTIARNDLWKNICLPTSPNTTLDLSIFNYSTEYIDITIYYSCSIIPGVSSVPLPNQICSSHSSFSFYLLKNESFSDYGSYLSCKKNITVPVNLAALPGISNLRSSADNLSAALNAGFELQWSANDATCNQCNRSLGERCGRYITSDSFICYNADGGFSFDGESKAGIKSSTNIIYLTVTLVIVLSVVLSIIGRCYHDEHKRNEQDIEGVRINHQNTEAVRRNDQDIEAFMRHWNSLSIKQYNYSELEKITNFFGEKLGEGGYGSVYKGKLPDDRLVAVKVLSEAKGDGQDFINEVSSISGTSHVNIVTLLGFCYIQEKALVYEFMPNGSLDKFIARNGLQMPDCVLEWKRLYQIAVGIARGLEYLHRGCKTRIVHFDIKPHNILLDEEFCPKISDFGLAKLSEKKESILSSLTVRGTPGYIAPEVFFRQFGGVSHKSDVYSYGIMVLEMVGVRTNVVQMERSSDVYFPQWIYQHLELGKELSIQAFTGEEDEEMSRKMMIVGLWCIQTIPSHRPSMSKVVEMLEGSLHSLQIPPKPFLQSPKSSPQHPSKSFSVGTDASSESIYIQFSIEN